MDGPDNHGDTTPTTPTTANTQVAAIVRGCSQYDLKRQSKEEKAWNQHVTTGKFDKWRLRRFLAEKFTDPKFLEARALLGYPKKPSEAP